MENATDLCKAVDKTGCSEGKSARNAVTPRIVSLHYMQRRTKG